MSDPFVAEIRVVGFNFAPQGWAFCDGQLMPISQNTALFSLLGTMYGGDGKSTFALPDLRGRVPISSGQGAGLSERFVGEAGGGDTVQLTASEMPAHVHAPRASTTSGTASPVGATWAPARSGRRNLPTFGAPAASPVAMSPSALSNTGGNQGHDNQQPYLVLNYIIALQGIFPPRQ